MNTVRTRFAPSPTGLIHLGNIRSALYPWAFARHNNGVFVLRIENTDPERSSREAVQGILDSMEWLGLDYDEGPFYQMQRMDRYCAVLEQLKAGGYVYPCYMSVEKLDDLRDQQRERGEKPRYNGCWRPEPGKVLPEPPVGVRPVLRFKNPLTGSVVWEDAVKGRIEISNEELDDLVVARVDGTPTYNFCVVVDDIDMDITHVIRGEDHVNNTPRQINIFEALGKQPPVYAHLPTVLNDQGEKMSKRNGAMSVLQYREEGYLPEAVMNYLARLGWAHGDAEVFSREQFVAWFDLGHLGQSTVQHNPEKLLWLNNQYLKQADNDRLAMLTEPFLQKAGVSIDSNGPSLASVVGLFKDRANTIKDIAMSAEIFYRQPAPSAEDVAQHMSDEARAAVKDLSAALAAMPDWKKEAISLAFKITLAKHSMKMPQLAMPVRLLVVGTTYTPAIDVVLELLGRDMVLARLDA